MRKELIKAFIKVFPNWPFISYLGELDRILKDCRTVLDLGCGESSPVSFLPGKFNVGVDFCKETINKASLKRTHNELILSRLEDLAGLLRGRSFDSCVALDVIEHLEKEDALSLIKEMESAALKKVVIFTPNGFNDPYRYGNAGLEEHRSDWRVDDFAGLGYQVIGIYGHAFLRSQAHSLRFHPRFLWGIISQLTHYFYTRNHPQSAAALLCFKDMSARRVNEQKTE